YTETSKEYSSIFNKFMNFLRENDVEPIVVVFPNTKYYSEYLNEIYEKEFYKIISNKKEYRGLKLIDFSKQDLFSEEDFIDFDHMSKNGAVKLTRELNKLI
ncbi:D-alanyl-lipoteichoic acid biosynthesis protein DltD, partial [Clostridium cadaveris]